MREAKFKLITIFIWSLFKGISVHVIVKAFVGNIHAKGFDNSRYFYYFMRIMFRNHDVFSFNNKLQQTTSFYSKRLFSVLHIQYSLSEKETNL